MFQAEGTRRPKRCGKNIACPRNSKEANADGADLSKRTLEKDG